MNRRTVVALAVAALSSVVLSASMAESIGLSDMNIKKILYIIQDTVSPPRVEGDAVSVEEFGVSADAEYYSEADGNYYADPEFETPSKDDTDEINRAIDYAYRNGISSVYIPEGKYLIDAEGDSHRHDFEYATNGGIQMKSGLTLEMADEAVLVTNTVDKPGYSLVTIDNGQDVKVTGGKIVGDIKTHPSGRHNYCYGITIANGSKDITVENVEITEAEDDGIMIADYFEELSDEERSSDIEIKNVYSHGNGRQGLTISTGSNIRVLDSRFSNQKKHMPMSGIDIELESYDHIGVKNIEISGNSFEENKERGIVLSNMFNSEPGSMSEDIVITNNTVKGSRFGITMQGKVDGLKIQGNEIEIDHMENESSFGISSESPYTVNATIEGNKVVSYEELNYSIGIFSGTPSMLISENFLVGQHEGIVVYGDGVTITGNEIRDTVSSPLVILGEDNKLDENFID